MIPEHDYGIFQSTIEDSLVLRNLQQLPCMTKKVRGRLLFVKNSSELAQLLFYLSSLPLYTTLHHIYAFLTTQTALQRFYSGTFLLSLKDINLAKCQ